MTDTGVLPAPVITSAGPNTDKWSRERQAFLALRPQLLESHRGKFVAIHEAKLVDSGDDKVALALRVYERLGYVPIYIGLVGEAPSQVRIPSRHTVTNTISA